MRTRDWFARGVLPGALAGLVGGLISGAALAQITALPSTASLVRPGAAGAGVVVHLIVAAILGAGFGVLVWHQRPGAGETLFWGLTYGALWWFLGPLTLLPLLRIGVIAWDVHSAQEAFASLLAHLGYGAAMGLALAAIRRDPLPKDALGGRALVGVLVRGAAAGLAGAWPLVALLEPRADGSWTPVIGLLGGVSFALLYPRPPDGTGPALVRGMVFGFFWWALWPLTIVPLARGAGLAWSVEDARTGFSVLPGYLLFGAAVGLGVQWLDGVARLLFSDIRGGGDQEGIGTEGLRAIGRGVLAGLAGGALFTVVAVRTGFIPAAAGLVGLKSALAGVTVQVVVACAIGASYGLFFRRQSFDVSSALGWGVAYGFLWWVLGPLTLMPILLGAAPQWTAEAAAALFGSLVAHFAYGAAMGVVFHLLEARFNPWWIPRSRVEEARVVRRREHLLTSAPALWALVVVIALTLPILLSR
ncbi:MAG: hypothetical protein QN168_10245 [Armatimonadota bacterium]|nr:hypothetical protein [Armatimonadota bacterium]